MLHHRWLHSLAAGAILSAGVAFTAQGQATVKKTAALPEPPASASDAKYVGAETCYQCHKEKKADFAKSLHGKTADSRTPASSAGCETCHGPGSKHADDPDNFKPRQFKTLGAVESAAVCTTCHTSGEQSASGTRPLSSASCAAGRIFS